MKTRRKSFFFIDLEKVWLSVSTWVLIKIRVPKSWKGKRKTKKAGGECAIGNMRTAVLLEVDVGERKFRTRVTDSE